MGLLSAQVKELERKAEQFDDAVDRIVALKQEIEDFESGDISQHSLINSFKSLISFYESSSRAYLVKLASDGYKEGALKKYSDSTFNGEKIITVKATADGEVFVNTPSGQYSLGHMSSDYTYADSFDVILCGMSFIDGLELLK